MPTPCDPAQEAGGGSISALRVTGDPAKGDPGGGGPPTTPPTPLIYWGYLSVTCNGDLPLATQRRVESILTPPCEKSPFSATPLPNFAPPSSPFNSILERSHSIAIFAFFFRYFSSTRPNEFFQIQAYLIHWFRLLALLFSLFARLFASQC